MLESFAVAPNEKNGPLMRRAVSFQAVADA
jgi:hypothetical protein